MRVRKVHAAVLIGAGAAMAAVTASAPASAAPPSGAHPVVLDCADQARVRPGSFLLACGDGNNYLTSLHWSGWSPGSAVATARDQVNDCRPYCAAGHFHGYRATVRLDHPKAWPGHPGRWHFTRLTVHYPANHPAGTGRDVVYPLWG
ncbi:hypothetical protein [Streptantibioticus cattleyicolor]|uniref:Secreted protein n=1 Tax=Streptantibioticus cattleyicolor (strain ATCC 35852 / DSM 46488 / JCM 4925 / NBRC 14057 / NRRL 8057) TaxID=1003195 RepID=F8JMS4_STREN|nr:hypothetical protein [Streptantibioticus cattleyicolor]AEW99290.1 secreted protein [Streptantibioticus cattleyicolor NRRL 8057 = DSM 46488]CCB71670.1 putative secreted protein [Streptantibioticus cattleyicolor NRRL 8057 = DSM 46488]